MKRYALIAVALLSLPAHAAKVTLFNQSCLESESAMVSVQPQSRPEITAEACNFGQQSGEYDPRACTAPAKPVEPVKLAAAKLDRLQPAAVVLDGEACQYGQLTDEDLSYVQSVQPANAVRRIAADRAR